MLAILRGLFDLSGAAFERLGNALSDGAMEFWRTLNAFLFFCESFEELPWHSLRIIHQGVIP